MPEKKAALLYGPAGVGKTSLVEAAAKEYRLSVVEMNASDFRRREDIERIAKTAAMQRGLFVKGKIILLDEVDGITGTADRGGLDAILDLIDKTRNPIVMTANDPWDVKLRPLRDAALLVPFYRLKERDIVAALKRICEKEGIECELQALRTIASRCEGDLRSAINDLESIARIYGRVTLDLVRTHIITRDRQYTPWEMLRNLFMSKYIWQAKRAVTHSTIDYDTMLEWLNENISAQYSDLEDIWRGYEVLSRADIYLGRIKRKQVWDLLGYVFDLAGPGVMLARRKSKFKWAKYRYPQKITLMAKSKEAREIREAIAAYLASRLHCSKASVKKDVLPFLSVIFRENPSYAARIALAYNLTDRMVSYLAREKSRDIITKLNNLKTGVEKKEKITKSEKIKTVKTPSSGLGAWLGIPSSTTSEETQKRKKRRGRAKRK